MTAKAFSFIDKIAEVKRNESLTAFFTLKGNEEFLQDHFADFPVMPGVLILQSLNEAATRLLDEQNNTKGSFYKMTACEGVKFGQFVRPGSHLRIEARLVRQEKNLSFLDGRIHLVETPFLDSALKQRVLQAQITLEKSTF